MDGRSLGHVDNAVFWPPLFPRNICLFRRRPGTRRAPNGYSLTNDESRAQKTASAMKSRCFALWKGDGEADVVCLDVAGVLTGIGQQTHQGRNEICSRQVPSRSHLSTNIATHRRQFSAMSAPSFACSCAGARSAGGAACSAANIPTVNGKACSFAAQGGINDRGAAAAPHACRAPYPLASALNAARPAYRASAPSSSSIRRS
jgi:hypothetical protein